MEFIESNGIAGYPLMRGGNHYDKPCSITF